MLFFKKVKLRSSCKFEENILSLSNITERHYTNSSFKFEGKIDEKDFMILPTFSYSQRELLRPEIVGHIESNQEYTSVITLIFRLPQGLKYLLIFGLTLNLSILLYLVLHPIENELIFKWQLFAVFIPLTGIIFLGYFNFKVEESIEILKSIFKATIEK